METALKEMHKGMEGNAMDWRIGGGLFRWVWCYHIYCCYGLRTCLQRMGGPGGIIPEEGDATFSRGDHEVYRQNEKGGRGVDEILGFERGPGEEVYKISKNSEHDAS